MRIIGLRAIYRSPRTSWPAPGHRAFPYLLRNAKVSRPNKAWAAGITYLPMARGFVYLVAVIDWHSRYVVAWRLSNTPRSGSGAGSGGGLLRRGIAGGVGPGQARDIQHRPEPAPSKDGGSQFTSGEFTQVLRDHEVKISMDGKGRYADNIFVERLWRTVKYEEVYLKDYAGGQGGQEGAGRLLPVLQ